MFYSLMSGASTACAKLNLGYMMIFFSTAFSFFATFALTGLLKDRLPRDGGRDFAVDGKKSAGKGRGAGIIFISVFTVSTLLFIPLDTELIIYLLVIILSMLSGFLDDAAKTPWGEYKKGIIDFVIALICAITYVHFNGSRFSIALLDKSFELPSWLFVILAVILIWGAINVVNCSDGVDGLSATLVIVSLIAFYAFYDSFIAPVIDEAGCIDISGAFVYKGLMLSFIFCLLAYLLFNANPSILMMGDAGSRAMGMFLAIIALKSGSPLLFAPLALIIILDGGLGLIKISCIRFLKLKNFMKNLRTPLHDHVRKNIEPAWSPTQVVFRFGIIHAAICMLYLGLLTVLRLS